MVSITFEQDDWSKQGLKSGKSCAESRNDKPFGTIENLYNFPDLSNSTVVCAVTYKSDGTQFHFPFDLNTTTLTIRNFSGNRYKCVPGELYQGTDTSSLITPENYRAIHAWVTSELKSAIKGSLVGELISNLIATQGKYGETAVKFYAFSLEIELNDQNNIQSTLDHLTSQGFYVMDGYSKTSFRILLNRKLESLFQSFGLEPAAVLYQGPFNKFCKIKKHMDVLRNNSSEGFVINFSKPVQTVYCQTEKVVITQKTINRVKFKNTQESGGKPSTTDGPSALQKYIFNLKEMNLDVTYLESIYGPGVKTTTSLGVQNTISPNKKNDKKKKSKINFEMSVYQDLSTILEKFFLKYFPSSNDLDPKRSDLIKAMESAATKLNTDPSIQKYFEEIQHEITVVSQDVQHSDDLEKYIRYWMLSKYSVKEYVDNIIDQVSIQNLLPNDFDNTNLVMYVTKWVGSKYPKKKVVKQANKVENVPKKHHQKTDLKETTKEVKQTIPTPKYDLFGWKTLFANQNKTEFPALKVLFDTFPKDEFSIWKMEYKFNTENKIEFMTKNLINGFIQSCDPVRKIALGVMLLSKDLEITGYWLLHGHNVNLMLDLVPDAEYYNWIKLDPENATDRNQLEEGWKHNFKESEDFDVNYVSSHLLI